MRYSSLVALAVLPFFGNGCMYAQNVRRNITIEPLYHCTDHVSHHRHEKLAREAYKQMALAYPDQEFSCDYRRGFVDGFTDYLDYGGTAEPPPMPSVHYRMFGFMTPDGLAAMDDWKHGWRHGGATARASNLRELIILPLYWGPKYPTAAPEPSNRPRMPAEKKVEVLPPPKLEPAVMPARPDVPPVAKPEPAKPEPAKPDVPPGQPEAPAIVPPARPEKPD